MISLNFSKYSWLKMKNIHFWLSCTVSITEVVVFLYMKRDEFWEFILLLDVLGKYFIFYKCTDKEPTVEHMELCPVSFGCADGREVWGEWTHLSARLSPFAAHLKASHYFYDYLFFVLAALGLPCWPRAFSSPGSGAPLPCSVQASHWVASLADTGSSSLALQLWQMGSVALWSVGSSQTRDRTYVPYTCRWILNH